MTTKGKTMKTNLNTICMTALFASLGVSACNGKSSDDTETFTEVDESGSDSFTMAEPGEEPGNEVEPTTENMGSGGLSNAGGGAPSGGASGSEIVGSGGSDGVGSGGSDSNTGGSGGNINAGAGGGSGGLIEPGVGGGTGGEEMGLAGSGNTDPEPDCGEGLPLVVGDLQIPSTLIANSRTEGSLRYQGSVEDVEDLGVALQIVGGGTRTVTISGGTAYDPSVCRIYFGVAPPSSVRGSGSVQFKVVDFEFDFSTPRDPWAAGVSNALTTNVTIL